MKKSGIIFIATKRAPLLFLVIVFCITVSTLFFAVQKFNLLPSHAANADGMIQNLQQNMVSIQNMQFMPSSLTIPVGTTVVWTNQENTTPHTVTSDGGSFDSGTLLPGQSFSFTFSNPGTFNYHCNIHPFMHGTIEVVTDNANPTPLPTESITPYPTTTPLPMPTPIYTNTQQTMQNSPYSISVPYTPTPINTAQPPFLMMDGQGLSTNPNVNMNTNTNTQEQSQNQINNNSQSVNITQQ